MNTKKKVSVVVASRANYGRCKTLLKEIDLHNYLELELIVCGSAILDRFGKTSEIIRNDGFKIHHQSNFLLSGSDLRSQSTTTGLAIIQLTEIFAQSKPDFVVTIADRYETLATAVASSYQNFPLIHLQGGDISGNIDDRVRHAITRLSDYHFPASKQSYENLINMGESRHNIWMLGCPSMDIVNNSPSFDELKNEHKLNSKFMKIKSKCYFLILLHSVTDSQEKTILIFREIFKALSVLDKFNIILISPNVDAGGERIRLEFKRLPKELQNRLNILENLEPEKFVTLIKNASICIGNSSSFLREAALCGTPSLILGNRQESREMGWNCTTIPKPCFDSILFEINKILKIKNYPPDTRFGNGDSGKKIADQISRLPNNYNAKPKLVFKSNKYKN